MSTRNRIRVDIAIVGGGIAGLWLLNLLRGRGYSAVLIECTAFGDGQTIHSQGMIHGGLKYALGGMLSTASEAISTMPARWRACLGGMGEVDLRGVRIASERYYLWSPDDAMLGRLGSFLASKALRGRVRPLQREQFPAPFDAASFSGAVYELDELVLDTASLLARLADAQRGHTLRACVRRDHFTRDGDGALASIRMPDREIFAKRFVLAAGAGNEALIDLFGESAPMMQRRPLHQLILRRAQLPAMFAHCVPQLSKMEPRLTVTSHIDAHGERLWYLGGQLASDGVDRSGADQITHARSELSACLPWIDLSSAHLEPLRVDRAEPQQNAGQRPDEAYVAAIANALICWPTKLALVPDLGDKVLARLPVPSISSQHVDDEIEAPPIAIPPWNR